MWISIANIIISVNWVVGRISKIEWTLQFVLFKTVCWKFHSQVEGHWLSLLARSHSLSSKTFLCLLDSYSLVVYMCLYAHHSNHSTIFICSWRFWVGYFIDSWSILWRYWEEGLLGKYLRCNGLWEGLFWTLWTLTSNLYWLVRTIKLLFPFIFVFLYNISFLQLYVVYLY